MLERGQDGARIFFRIFRQRLFREDMGSDRAESKFKRKNLPREAEKGAAVAMVIDFPDGHAMAFLSELIPARERPGRRAFQGMGGTRQAFSVFQGDDKGGAPIAHQIPDPEARIAVNVPGSRGRPGCRPAARRRGPDAR